MYYSELINEINNLKEMLVIVDGNLKHNINVFWAALAIGLTLVGLVSVGWLRYFVAEEVQKKLNDEVEKKLVEYMISHQPIQPSLINGWLGRDVHYIKDEYGYVTLDGLVYGVVYDKPMMSFPNGYRPIEKLTVPLICSEGYAECIIDTDGSVTVKTKPLVLVRFSSLKFKAA